ncbi:MAG: hypothetical protein Q7T16_04785 [Candidatus Burarchaeum sp.]|nr:hypothetical protein [Candidatus Burarchaeum sp.]MDO8339945.1 hypothetical protein [Candidatus Burarchaeum sp.]
MVVDIVTNFMLWYQGNSHVLIGLILVLLGPFVAQLVGGLVKYGFKMSKIERWLRDHGLHDAIVGISPIAVIVTLVKLSVFMIFLSQGALTANMDVVSAYAADFVNVIKTVIWAVIILSVGLIIGDYVSDRIKEAKGILFSGMIAMCAEGFIVYLALVSVFESLGMDALVLILSNLLTTLVSAFALAIALAFGLAFGLGMKDAVAQASKERSGDINQFLGRLKKK